MTWTVRYRGVLGDVSRTFDTETRARQWAAQVGKPDATIAEDAPTAADDARIIVGPQQEVLLRLFPRMMTPQSTCSCGSVARWREDADTGELFCLDCGRSADGEP